MRCSGAASAGRIASRRSSDSERCAPRLVGTRAWISSMMTVSIARSASRAFDVRSRYSDSGVVMRMSAGSRWNRARSIAGVSPVRTAIDGTWCASPRALDRLAIPASGARRFRSMSTASALSGEIYSTRHRRSRSGTRVEHQPVDAPEEGGQRLAAAGRRQDQGRVSTRDRRPSERLRWCRSRERIFEPLHDRRVKQAEGVSRRKHISILVDRIR